MENTYYVTMIHSITLKIKVMPFIAESKEQALKMANKKCDTWAYSVIYKKDGSATISMMLNEFYESLLGK